MTPIPLTPSRVRARPTRLFPTNPVATAYGPLPPTSLLLVDIATREGATGRSYVRCYAPELLLPLRRLVQSLGEALCGSTGMPMQLCSRLEEWLRFDGRAGLAGLATAAIDMCLWDAEAQLVGAPLARLFAPAPRATRAYLALRSTSARDAAAEAEDALDRGFRGVKLKLGAGSLDSDLAAVRAVRQAVGEGVCVMADYNQCLSIEDAAARLERLEGEGLAWIEEPVASENYDGIARLRRRVATPLQLGENESSIWGVGRCLAVNPERVMVDVPRIGGVTGWLHLVRSTAAQRAAISTHAYPEISNQLLATTPQADWLEYVDHAGPLLARRLRIENGLATIPACAGSGIAWDEEAVTAALL